MNYFIFIESFGSSSTQDDIGIVLLLAVPILLLIALIVGIAKKNQKAKMIKKL